MQPPYQRLSINFMEMKIELVKKIGPERSKRYFEYLNRFLSLKLSKVEFDKLCLRTVGRDGVKLHNQLICSILRNVVSEKVLVGKKVQNGGLNTLNIPNGDVLLTSPKKVRTGRGGDRKSGLGPNGKINYKPVQHYQEVVKQVENVDESLGQKDWRSLLRAPLGIPYCPVSIGGARKALPISSGSESIGGVSETNSLLETITLRARIEHVATTQGVERVSVDCADVLNNGLDAYLKGLIRSCSQPNRLMSLLDFRVAMEVNPQQLGEDWPVLLEKICTRAFEETDSRSL
nr:transcriptional coactivator Hfi1/transcriptional adapter 1 [Tanacetum cinerariifolium]